MAYLPCLNPNCKSHGAPHPNCKCYDNLSSSEQTKFKSQNKLLKSQGEEEYQLPGTYKKQKRGAGANSLSALGNDIGPGYAEGGEVHYCSSCMPHHKDCEYYADGGDVERNAQFHVNPDLAVDQAVASHGLVHLLTKTGVSRSENPHKSTEDFMDHSKRGHHKIGHHVNGMFDKQMPDHGLTDDSVSELKNQISDFQTNPDKLLDIGGNMGNNLPDHSGLVAAKAANATTYLSGLKPLGNQLSPFDKIQPPSKIEESHYNRQVSIAEQPLSILPHIKNGTIQPADLNTVRTLYPSLYKSMTDKAFEAVADAKQKGTKLTYKHKMGLSALLGPLDSTQTPQAMQAIMASAAGNTKSETQQKSGGKISGATAQTQKTIDKTNKIYQTNLDQLQMKKS